MEEEVHPSPQPSSGEALIARVASAVGPQYIAAVRNQQTG